MNLRQRFAELLQIITKNIPEREYHVQLGFLTTLIQEPFYLYGHPGCGSSLIIRRISSAFKDAKILKLSEDTGAPVVGKLTFSQTVREAEALHKTVIEAFPESDMAKEYIELSKAVLEHTKK